MTSEEFRTKMDILMKRVDDGFNRLGMILLIVTILVGLNLILTSYKG